MGEGFGLNHVSSSQKNRRSPDSAQSHSKSGFRISIKDSTHTRTDEIPQCLTTHNLLSQLEFIGSARWLHPEELAQILLKVLKEQANQETPIVLSKERLVKAALSELTRLCFPHYSFLPQTISPHHPTCCTHSCCCPQHKSSCLSVRRVSAPSLMAAQVPLTEEEAASPSFSFDSEHHRGCACLQEHQMFPRISRDLAPPPLPSKPLHKAKQMRAPAAKKMVQPPCRLHQILVHGSATK